MGCITPRLLIRLAYQVCRRIQLPCDDLDKNNVHVVLKWLSLAYIMSFETPIKVLCRVLLNVPYAYMVLVTGYDIFNVLIITTCNVIVISNILYNISKIIIKNITYMCVVIHNRIIVYDRDIAICVLIFVRYQGLIKFQKSRL